MNVDFEFEHVFNTKSIWIKGYARIIPNCDCLETHEDFHAHIQDIVYEEDYDLCVAEMNAVDAQAEEMVYNEFEQSI